MRNSPPTQATLAPYSIYCLHNPFWHLNHTSAQIFNGPMWVWFSNFLINFSNTRALSQPSFIIFITLNILLVMEQLLSRDLLNPMQRAWHLSWQISEMDDSCVSMFYAFSKAQFPEHCNSQILAWKQSNTGVCKLSLQSHTVNISVFAGHMVSATVSQLCHESA